MSGEHTRPPFLAVALISATALAYELLLLRLFALAQWHHFAYMVISLALLGYGASGSFIALAQRRLLPRFEAAFVINLCLFGLSAVSCALIAQRVPFNPEEVLWDLRQPQRLLLIYMLLALPFFFAANAVALALTHCRARIPRIYAADMLGAGIGSLSIIALLTLSFPVQVLGMLGASALLAAAVAAWELRLARRSLWTLAALLGAAALWTLADHSVLAMSPYKPLSQQLRIPGARIIAERSSPLGVVSVVESPQVPLRDAPGLSLAAQAEPPRQLAVFTDGDGMTVITDGNRPAQEYQYLDLLTCALPFHLAQPRSVLVLGAGGGSMVLQARMQGVPAITAVELNPQVVDLVRGEYAAFAGHLYDLPGVRVHVGDARGFVAAGRDRHDLIQIAFLDSFGASAAGLRALHENYLYTQESFTQLLAHLAPGGWLALTRWIDLPPRDLLKLAVTAATALERSGVRDPGARMLLIRGWQTGTLLVKNGAITRTEVDRARRFAAARSFDLDWAPGLAVTATNRYNQLAEPYFFRDLQALLGPQRAAFLAHYKFDVRPPSDDRPYFSHFARLSTLPELLRLRGRGGMPLIEWGYLILVATLAQALLASAVLILLPLWILRRRAVDTRGQVGRTIGYFGAVGLAFLFIEIACIQHFTLLLHHPVYAAATVLTGFLVFAGLGSAYAGRLAQQRRHALGVRAAALAIMGLILVYLLALGPLFDALLIWPLWARVVVSLLLIMPLAFAMGLPFALGLDRLARNAPALIPWAWGVNGYASVVSAVLATLLAVHFGFNVVLLSAAVLYALAALWLPRELPSPGNRIE
jgi:spermidine synthase